MWREGLSGEVDQADKYAIRTILHRVSEAEIGDTASPEDSARATAITAVRRDIPLVVEKTALPDPVRPGEMVTYTLTVSNRGTTNLTGVVLTDVAPAQVFAFSESSTDGGIVLGLVVVLET